MQNVECMELVVIKFNVAESVVIIYLQKTFFRFRIMNTDSEKSNFGSCAGVTMMIYFWV